MGRVIFICFYFCFLFVGKLYSCNFNRFPKLGDSCFGLFRLFGLFSPNNMSVFMYFSMFIENKDIIWKQNGPGKEGA